MGFLRGDCFHSGEVAEATVMAWVRSELPTGAGTVEGLERDGHAGGASNAEAASGGAP